MKTLNNIEEEKLASMKEMMDNIAHQWRQPLSQINSIVGVIDNKLFEMGIEDAFITQKLEEIEKLTKYMSDTIDDFKGYFGENNQKELFSVAEVIDDALDVLEHTFKKYSIRVESTIRSNISFDGYRNELKQIIIILLNNAKDILVTRNIHNPCINVSLQERGEDLIISVCDNGGGMTKSVRAKLFEPYFTTKHKSQGTGLGLYMSRKIIDERFHGVLDVENKDDGVCFYITLPKG